MLDVAAVIAIGVPLVSLYHTYSIAQTYELQVLAVDTEDVQTNQTLTNPTLNVQSFTNPTVVSNVVEGAV